MSPQRVQTIRDWAIEQTRVSARSRFVRSLLGLLAILTVLSFVSGKLGLLPITGTPALLILTGIFVHDCQLGRNPWLVRGVVNHKRALGDARATHLRIDLQNVECLELLADGTLRRAPATDSSRAQVFQVAYAVFAASHVGDQIAFLAGPDRVGLTLV